MSENDLENRDCGKENGKECRCGHGKQCCSGTNHTGTCCSKGCACSRADTGGEKETEEKPADVAIPFHINNIIR